MHSELPMIRRRLLTLSASVALHLTALGLALGLAGAGAGSAILVDLVTDVEGRAVGETRAPSAKTPASGRREPGRMTPTRRPTPAPARLPSSPISSAPTTVRGGSTVPEPLSAPGPGISGEARSKREEEPESGSAVAAASPVADPDMRAAPPEREAAISPLPSDAATSRREHAAPGGGGSGAGASASAGPGVDTGLSGFATALNASSAEPGTAGAGQGGIPPEYGPYLERFRRRLQESLEYPLAARRRGLSGRVELEILLEPSGRVGSVRVISSSSHAVLDDAALQAVRRLVPEPFSPPLPRRPLRIRLPLGFELE